MNRTRFRAISCVACAGVVLTALGGYLAARQGQISLAAGLAGRTSLVAFAPRFSAPMASRQDLRPHHGPAIRSDLFTAPFPSGGSADSRFPGFNALPPTAPLASLSFPGDPLANFTYIGFVTVDGRTMALIENRATHEGWYVAEGDLWQNSRIEAVGPDEISVVVEGKTRTLVKSDAFSAVPLLADAPGMAPLVAPQESSPEAIPASIDKWIALKLEANGLLTDSVTKTYADIDLDITAMDATGITIEGENSAPQAVQSINDIYDYDTDGKL